MPAKLVIAAERSWKISSPDRGEGDGNLPSGKRSEQRQAPLAAGTTGGGSRPVAAGRRVGHRQVRVKVVSVAVRSA
jgi:hypothetical protein